MNGESNNVYFDVLKIKERKFIWANGKVLWMPDIFVYWEEQGMNHAPLIKEVAFESSPLDSVAVPASLKDKFPLVHKYLINFGNRRAEFDFSVLELGNISDFTRDVYLELFHTNIGETLTYGELAVRAGYPRAARAVGNAMHKNRHLLLIPCHRVLASNGIGGFGRWIGYKKLLLKMEAKS